MDKPRSLMHFPNKSAQEDPRHAAFHRHVRRRVRSLPSTQPVEACTFGTSLPTATAMKRIDTTDAISYSGTSLLAGDSSSEGVLRLADRFRIHIAGVYAGAVGREWGSADKHESDCMHHINIQLSGRRQVVHDGRVHRMEPGQVWFLSANTPVERKCTERSDVIFFKIFCECLPGIDPLADWSDREPRLAGTCDVAEFRNWLAPRRGALGLAEILRLRGLLLQWVASAIPELGQVLQAHLKIHARFAGVYSVIEEQLGADLRMATLAKTYGSTTEAFSIEFFRSTGIRPKEYLTRRLNQEAMKWLTHSNTTIKEIAATLRFTDQYYFSRFFKKVNGCTPTEYRERFRED
jgi:AraC-like DNA-binding protein